MKKEITDHWKNERELDIKLFGCKIGNPSVEEIIEQPESDYKLGFRIIDRVELTYEDKLAMKNWCILDTING